LKAIVIGANGATGRELIKILLLRSEVKHILALTRKKLEVSSPKLDVHVVNFAEIDKYSSIIKGDILFSALGTTLKDAKSKTKQFEVDYTYQYNLAKISSENNVKTLSLVSSSGANENSLFFYPKIKGLLESSVKQLNFENIQIYQPPFLIRQSDVMRSNEKIGIFIFKALNSVGILNSLRPLPVSRLAEKMVNEALKKHPQRVMIFENKDIID
tara:strand:+ start:125 stop:766 length:642 start_codon:yes stop_codon:yes gene_type:complete